MLKYHHDNAAQQDRRDSASAQGDRDGGGDQQLLSRTLSSPQRKASPIPKGITQETILNDVHVVDYSQPREAVMVVDEAPHETKDAATPTPPPEGARRIKVEKPLPPALPLPSAQQQQAKDDHDDEKK